MRFERLERFERLGGSRGSKGWGFSSADVGVIIGAGFQTGVYKSSQSSTERLNTFKRLGIIFFKSKKKKVCEFQWVQWVQ